MSAPALLVSALMVSGLTGGCASTVHADLPPGVVSVVAATSVWGDVAQQVGGRWVAVTSVISNPSQDPHSFEGSARVLLAVKKADLLIENGGGYDYFMHQMIGAADTTAPVIDAVQVSGHRAPPRGELNEHVWYDIHSAAKVADAVAARLREIEPGHARYFSSQAAAFRHGVARLAAAERRVRQLASGQGVGITEPLPLYLLDAMGLRNLTPPEFSRAVEDGGEVAARVLAETLDLYSQHRVVALVYNSQTSSPVTEQVEDAARSAGVAVVPVTETMPAGDTYLTWMRRNIAAVARAVSTQ